jgi:diguanylate cyclase (GGDEF)-like protein
MFKIGAQQSQSMMTWFLILAAVSLLGSVGALLVSVRYVTRGLPQLSRAAASVAKGELDVPFAATGVGEVRSLAVAFETMLSNLQSSLGQIRQLAYFDPVTGLSNREKIRLDAAALLRGAAPSDAVAFLFIDLNRFKSINDTFSHKVGDQLLAKVAERMRDFFASLSVGDLRGEPLMARLGGDEFLVVLRADRDRSNVTELVERLLDVLREPYEIGPARMMAGASIGVSLYPFHGDDYETLLMSADVAMYVAKRRGGSNCVFFTADAAEIMQERLAIENDLKIAVRDRRLEVHYQPKVSCTTGRIVGVEALARWQHPKRDYVSPSKFIAIAEEAGLVPDIGLFVLERSIEDFARVLGGAEPVSLAVNVSVIQLEDLNFAAALDAILQRTGFPPTLLELEITESMAMRNSDVVQDQIAQLRALGIRFAIDDFGTGYSNLATLARLPVDVIKLDRSLVADLPASAEKQTIVRTILGLARSFGFSTVAEGVETQDELDYVVREGVDIAQGYLFSPAVPISTLLLLLQPSGLVDVIRSLSPAGTDRRRIAPASR